MKTFTILAEARSYGAIGLFSVIRFERKGESREAVMKALYDEKLYDFRTTPSITEMVSRTFEIIAVGFDGSTSDTDDRVIWVSAPSLERLMELMRDVPHSEINPIDEGFPIDYDLADPAQITVLCEKLKGFANV